MSTLKILLPELFQFRSWNWSKYLDLKNRSHLDYCHNLSGWRKTDVYKPMETTVLQTEKGQISPADMKMIKALKPVKA